MTVSTLLPRISCYVKLIKKLQRSKTSSTFDFLGVPPARAGRGSLGPGLVGIGFGRPGSGGFPYKKPARSARPGPARVVPGVAGVEKIRKKIMTRSDSDTGRYHFP